MNLSDFSAAASQHHVLYVDDDAVNIMLMQALFEQRPDCRLSVAANGRQALDLAPLVPPELLLLDLRLPDCSGVDLLERLRRRFDRSDLPAVAVTAEYDFVPFGSGFDEVWRKPVDVRHVLRRLDAWLGRLQAPHQRELGA